MATWTIPIGSPVNSTCFFDTATNACWFVGSDGSLRALRLLGQANSAYGSGWSGAAAALPSIDGLNLFAVMRSGEILVAARGDADRQSATELASLGAPAVAATRLSNDNLVILDDSGKISVLTPKTGALRSLAIVDGAVALSVDDPETELLVVTVAQVHRVRLSDGSAIGAAVDVPAGLAPLASICADADGAILCGSGGVLARLDWTGNIDPFSPTIPQATSLCRWHSLIIAAAGSALELVEWGEDADALKMAAGLDPLAPGGWAPFEVDYGSAGLSQGDVDWDVAEGPEAATISVARPSGASPQAYEHRVIAGARAGEFKIVARDRASGTVVATRRFRTVAVWPDADIGPAMAFVGPQRVYAKPGWGGGPDGPQNINIIPAPEEFRIAAAVFRLKGSTSAIDAAARIAELKKNITDPGRSVVRYYEEASYRRTPAAANPAHPKGTTVRLLGDEVFGPIDINSSWGDLFVPGNMDDPWSSWNPNGNAWDVLGGEFSTFLQDRGLSGSVTQLADAFVLMVLPGTDDPYTVGDKTWPSQWNWAFAADSQVYWKGSSWTTFTRRPSVTMPAGFPVNHPSPWSSDAFMSTICHELGHTLGCPDLYAGADYSAELAGRYVEGWDLMESDVPLSHFSLAHRMRLGWISPDWIEVCDFGKNPASRTITLQAIETLTRSGPPAGRKAGVEIRIRDGWNYYFEYRRKQADQMGDQSMPKSQAILGTDVNEAKANEAARPLILLLPNDADGDGPVLRQAAKNYEESDTTNPDRLNDFIFTRRNTLPLDNNAVNVQIDYVGAFRPELQITPAPGRGNFKSPDIWLDGPAGAGVAVKGKLNRIRVNVHNKGTKAGDAVQIRVQWLPFTTAPGPWNPLPNPPTQAIPAHSTREFSLDWNIPASIQIGGVEVEHFCVRVDIDRYVDPTDPTGSEIVVHNNWAQSNFATDTVAHASPSERRSTAVTATNILARGALHSTLIEQTSDYFRAYVDHSWRRLDPNQTDTTRIWYETLAGDPIGDRDFQLAFRQASPERGLANNLTARAIILPDREFDGSRERWGVELDVRAGIRTQIRNAHGRGELVQGQVLAESGETVTSGAVRLVAWPERRPDHQLWSDGQVGGQGEFWVGVPAELVPLAQHELVLLTVYYLGSSRFAPCQSREFELRTG